jgi:UrcA family protein
MFANKILKPNMRVLLAVAATVIAAAPICSRADDSAPAAARVKYTASDLSTVEGAKRIYWHIEQAANSACGTSNMDTDVIMRGPSPCVQDAIARAVNAISNPVLARVYVEKNGPDLAQKFGVAQDVRTVRN